MSVDPQDYYQNLSKKEKGKFLRYLSGRYSYSVSTMGNKLRENNYAELRVDEREILEQVILSGVWKK